MSTIIKTTEFTDGKVFGLQLGKTWKDFLGLLIWESKELSLLNFYYMRSGPNTKLNRTKKRNDLRKKKPKVDDGSQETEGNQIGVSHNEAEGGRGDAEVMDSDAFADTPTPEEQQRLGGSDTDHIQEAGQVKDTETNEVGLMDADLDHPPVS